MMAPVCAINYNARIYDPTIGRFMAADSMIKDVYSPQTLNRYTYVDNGPLSFTDPTGNDPGANIGNNGSKHGYEWERANDPDLSCYGACGQSDEEQESVTPIQNAKSTGMVDGGSSGSGLTADMTLPLGDGNQIRIPGGQKPDANGNVQGTLIFDTSTKLGAIIAAANSDLGGAKFTERTGMTTGTGEGPQLWYASTGGERPLQDYQRAFFDKYYIPITALEDQLRVCRDCILGVAAHEGKWGQSRGALENNNVFGMDNKEGNTILKFDSTAAAIQHWGEKYGPGVMGDRSTAKFVSDLAKEYHARDPAWASEMTGTINSVQRAEKKWNPPI